MGEREIAHLVDQVRRDLEIGTPHQRKSFAPRLTPGFGKGREGHREQSRAEQSRADASPSGWKRGKEDFSFETVKDTKSRWVFVRGSRKSNCTGA